MHIYFFAALLPGLPSHQVDSSLKLWGPGLPLTLRNSETS